MSNTILATSYTLNDAIPQIHDIYDMNLVSISEVQAHIVKVLTHFGYKNFTNWTIARSMTDSIAMTAKRGKETITFSIRQTTVLSSI